MSTLCFRIDSLTDDTLTLGIYDRNPMTLQLDAVAKDGSQSSSTVDMSCLSPNMSLDARCDEIVTPSVREPFSYRLSLVVFDGETELAYASTQDTGDSVTATIATSIDTLLNFSLSARISSGADGRNSYALENVSLASIIAAGSDGVRLTLVNCQEDLSGVNCSIPVWMSCVDNGSNSYTFTFMTGVEASSNTELVLDLVSGTNRVDMKPLLTKIGGHVEYATSRTQLPFGDGDDDYSFNPIIFATNSGNACINQGTISPSWIESAQDGSLIYYWGTLPTYYALMVIGPTADTFYAPPGISPLGCEQCVIADLIENGVTLTGYDINTNVPNGKTLDLTAEEIHTTPTEYHSGLGIKFSLWGEEPAGNPMLCLEPSCDPCIDLSPMLSSTLSSVTGSFSCDSPIEDSINFAVYYDGQSVGSTQYADFGGSLTIGRSNVTSFYLYGYISDGTTPVFYFSGVTTSHTIAFSSLSIGTEIPLMPLTTTPAGFPAELRLIVTALPATNTATFKVQDNREPMPTLTLTSTQKSGVAAEQSIDMSCITDIVDDKFGDLSPVATSGSFNDLTDTPTNHVTTDTNQTITGVKTFGAGVYGNVVAMSAGAIDVSAGTVFTKTITANTTISFTNVPAAPATACVTLILTNGGSKTVTWPSSVKWSGGSAPDLTASGVDVLTFLTIDGGTTWYGTVNSLGAA